MVRMTEKPFYRQDAKSAKKNKIETKTLGTSGFCISF
jgi:hypothetical protein